MPPRRPLQPTLDADDVTALAEAVATGRRRTVYLREGVPSLGVAPGASARVVSVADGVVTARPRGVGDDLPFEAAELAASAAAARAPLERAPRPPRAPRERPAPRSSTRATTVQVVLAGSADGWTVEVTDGRGKPARAVPVSAEAVARAVTALDEPRARAAVDGLLARAREQARTRVDALAAELAAAQASLDALTP